jgi:hypothetical protein
MPLKHRRTRLGHETPDDVRRAVEATFPKKGWAKALAKLRRGYRWRWERIRVQLAVVALANGDLDELRAMVKAANEDPRDVLFWAETPTESGYGTKRQMRARYRRMGVPMPEDLA